MRPLKAALLAGCAGVLASLLLVTAASAQSKAGTAFGAFLLIEPSARAAGMGNAGVAVDAGLAGAFFNPAAVARIQGWSVEFSHAAWLADVSYDYVAVGAPVGKWGKAFTSLTALGSGEMDVRTVEHPLGTGDRFSVSDLALGLGYALEVTDRFSAGAQLTWAQERIWHSSAGTVVFNIGTMYRTSPKGIRIGASLSNFGTGAGFDGRDLRILYDQDPTRYGDNGALPGTALTNQYSVPVLFRAGVGKAFQLAHDTQLDVVADAFHPSDNNESVSLGTELTLYRMLALRAGYQSLFLEDSEVGLTFGAGVNGKHNQMHYQLDYAWADQGRLGDSHRFTLGFLF